MMKKKPGKILAPLFIAFGFIPLTALTQDTASREDYKRAVSFLRENVINKKAFNLHIQPHWMPDSSGLQYTHHRQGEKKYLKVLLPDMIQTELFDHSKLASLLSDSLAHDIHAHDLPVTVIRYLNADELLLRAEDKQFIFNVKTNVLTVPEPEKEKNASEKDSPCGTWTAYARDHNLYLKNKETGKTRQMSFKGEKGYEYASWYGWGDIMTGENGERPRNFAVQWSPDSKWLHADICDLRTAQKMYLLDFSADSLYRPGLLSYYRGSPGDTAMVYLKPAFFCIRTGKEITPDLPKSTHINSISVQWSKDPGRVYLKRSERGFQKLSIYSFDLENEALETIYEESSDTGIDNFQHWFKEDSGLMFFLSEKSGHRQLYSLHLAEKKETAVTKGTFFINSIERIDEKNKRVYFTASGREKGRNPYFQHLYSISFDGKDMTLLTPEDRNHTVSLSPDGMYAVDNMSTVNTETITVLRNALSGSVLRELGRADVSGIENWSAPEIFTAAGRDGKTAIFGALWKPTNFDPSKQYPIIDHSYTGPHTNVFPGEFRAAFNNQALAELGFIVMMVDGLGTSGRSKEFKNHSYGNLGGGLEDHVLAMRQLAERYAWIDTSRVGIFGHSAGGYDAGRAMLQYPDFYKVSVASAADHDHRMEKAWWPEMYMGWPVGEAYHEQSNITNAANLKGKIMLIHGGIDENVNPSATFKLAEAFIKADKPFDMLIIPGQSHGYRGIYNRYVTKVRWNYFVRHLLEKEPLWDFDWE